MQDAIKETAHTIFQRGRWATTMNEIVETFVDLANRKPTSDEQIQVFRALSQLAVDSKPAA